jgi:hypothetical protein
MAYIYTNDTKAYVPQNAIFWWANPLGETPQYTSQFVKTPSSNETVYNRFLLGTINETLVGTLGGNASHFHEYNEVFRHTHIHSESSHAHYYRRASSNLYGVSTASDNVWVSNPSVPLMFTDYAYSNVDILPAGKILCETESEDALPPYYKLGFVQAMENLGPSELSNPIELAWYWWMIIGSAGTLTIGATVSVLVRRKKRKVDSV